MHEIELKFQVPARRRAALDAAVAGRARAPRQRLQAAYFDTAERELAAAGLALRLRREGRRWVQTLKGAADGMTRHEHNVARGSEVAAPAVDPDLHAGTAVGDALLALLGGRGAGALTVLYGTDVRRRTRVLRGRHGQVELALDDGRIAAPGRALDVLEFEIELVRGAPRAVLETARHWLPRFGLWLDTRSKAERGDLLARGEAMAPPRRAPALQLAPAADAATLRQAVLRACAEQITGNASQVASGTHAPEHVHQLRVGLRRLRSALRLFDGVAAPSGAGDAGLADAAAHLFRALGAARDRAVIDAEFAADLRAALQRAGVPANPPVAPPAAAAAEPTTLVREIGTQLFLLDLLAASHTAADGRVDDATPPDDPAWRAQLTRRLNRWHRQVVADARRYAQLDEPARHRLRKRAKRLRYAAEFVAAWYRPRAVRRYRRYVKALDALQDRLGAVSDVVVAMAAFRHAGEADPHAWFALGWLARRHDALVRRAARESKAFVKVERFWTR